MSRLIGVGITVVLIASGVAAPAAAVGQEVPSPACPQGTLRAGSLPPSLSVSGCDLTGLRVRTPAGTLVVPELGEGVGVERILVGGETRTYTIWHRSEGTLETDLSPNMQQASRTARIADTGCSGTAFATDQHHIAAPWQWRWNSNGMPNAKRLKSALTRGLQNVASRRTNCGSVSPLPAAAQPSYLGKTTRLPNIGSSGTCGPRDQSNVVGFGPLDSYWGYACWWFDSQFVTTEADVELSSNLNWWTARAVTECSNRPDLEGLATHEFGHVYGLLHVDEGTDPDQTMSTYINGYCSKRERTLGTGDLAGLQDLYGS